MRSLWLLLGACLLACGGETASSGGNESGGSAGADAGSSTGGMAGIAGEGTAGSAGMSGSGGTDAGCAPPLCVPTPCTGKLFQCGDCMDNDGDGLADTHDPDCWGACQDAESSFSAGIPASSASACVQDCYFDSTAGSADDGCSWSHSCDPLEKAPGYDTSGKQCAYDPKQPVPGTSSSCATLQQTQPAQCATICGPVVPNGCDCFGCCQVPGAPTAVFLGSTDAAGSPTCTAATLSDPEKCRPCTPVPACFNPCESCELCLGKTSLPPECGGEQQCKGGSRKCGLPCQPGCPAGEHCVTGCCVAPGQCGPHPGCPAGVQPCGLSCQSPCPQEHFCMTGCCYIAPP